MNDSPESESTSPKKRGRARAQGKSAERQKAFAWYAVEKGMSLRHWWDEPGIFKFLDEKRKDRTRTGKRKDPDVANVAALSTGQEIPPNLDIHAAYFWETLRRSPDGKLLREEWRGLVASDAGNLFSEQSRYRRFRHEHGPDTALALDDFCGNWKRDYLDLLSDKESVPGGWLIGYRRLWDKICQSESLPLPIPWRFDGASQKVLHGAACTDLVIGHQVGEKVDFEEALSPFRGKYTSEITSDFGLTSFATAVDADGRPLPEITPENLLGLIESGSPARSRISLSDHHISAPKRVPVSSPADDVHLLIRWSELVEILKPFGMIPKLIAVNPSAPESLIAKEFSTLVRKERTRGESSRKLSQNSFVRIVRLDREVKEGVPLETTVSEFDESAGLDGSRLIQAIRQLRQS